jgi:hypothetical protein
MARTRYLSPAFAALVLLTLHSSPSAAAPAPAGGREITLPYPDKVPLAVHLNGLEQARKRLSKMLEALPADEAKAAQAGIEEGFEKLLAGRKLTAVPADGRVFVVIHDLAALVDGEPAVSVLMPATGVKEFKASFLTADEQKSVQEAGKGIESVRSMVTGEEATVYLVALKDYVALTPSKETAEVYAGKYTPAQSGAMGPELSASYLNADVSIFVNMDVVNDRYGEQIRQFKGLIDFALGQAEMGGMIPGLSNEQLEVVKQVLNGFVQAIEDSRGLVIAAEFRPEGLAVRANVRFAEGTKSAGMLKPESPTALADLSRLPRGLSMYGGSRFGPRFAELSRKLNQEFAGGEDEKATAAIRKQLEAVAAAGPQGEYSASTTPDIGITVTAYEKPDAAAAASISLYKGMRKGTRFASVVVKDKAMVEEAAVEHRGFKFAKVQLQLDFEASVENFPEPLRESTLNQFKRLMKERSTFWIGTDGKVVVQLTGSDWDAGKKLLDAYLDGKGGIGTEPGFQLTRKNLPEEATLIYVLETSQVLTLMIEQVKSAGAMLPGGLPPIGQAKPVAGPPTFVGLALTLKPQAAGFEAFLPGTAMNVATRMIVSLFRPID